MTADKELELTKEILERVRVKMIKLNKDNPISPYKSAALNDHLLCSIWWVDKLISE